MMQMHLVFT